MDLTDEQWKMLEPLIGEMPRRADSRGRLWRGSREVLNGILWACGPGRSEPICSTGSCRTRPAIAVSSAGSARARWSGCWRRLPGLSRPAASSTCLNASSMAPSWSPKKGGGVGATKRGKGTKLMAMADRFGLPLATCAASAAPHEVTLVAATLDSRFVTAVPERLIGDRAYDADPT